MRKPNLTRQIWILVTSIFVLLSVATSNVAKLNGLFNGHHEFNGVFYSQIAKNYLRLGLNTKLAQITTAVDLPTKEVWGTHTHHPPTYPLILALWFKFFGISEWSARLLSLTLYLLGMAMLGMLGSKLFHNPFAPLFILPVVLTPLFRYYAVLPVFEAVLFPLTVALLISYYRKHNFFIFLFSFLLILTDWPGYWPVLVLMTANGVKVFLSRPISFNRRQFQSLYPYLNAILLGSGLILLIQWISTGSAFTDLAGIGSLRLFSKPFAEVDWWKLLISRSRAFLGLPIVLTLIVSIVYLIKNSLISFKKLPLSSKLITNQACIIILASLISGSLHILVFRNITWYHDYMLLHLLPFISLSLVLALNFIYQKSAVSAVSTVLVLSLLTLGFTQPFYQALGAMTPHQDCIDHATMIKEFTEIKAIYLNQQKVVECGPFINFYADRTVELKLE